MAHIDIITRRLASHQAALATTGIDPDWDKALHAYLRADIMQHADLEFGQVAQANERRFRDKVEIEAKYGKDWKANTEAQAAEKASYERTKAADDHWANGLCSAFWRAGRELALTPAPSMAAVAFKASMIEADDLNNDIDFPANCMRILQADFIRLAEEAA